MKHLSPLIAGLLFGAGLVVSGMTDPNRVLAFLDVAGAWDPSLALVMLGALLPAGAAYQWMRGRNRTLTGLPVQLPVRTQIDLPLAAGAVLFGTGWGLLGLCPGPAVAMLSTGQPTVLMFLAAMLLGMGLYQARPPRRISR
ncbi:YeeE/YedE family protein [Stenotrophomonas oahuensis]|uniref:YeeE/YedE family protein n=1 Tax=Stenotrophomonas oahuensis TaxID=3003271 RepID=A0ABY9YMS3_9GAMM|nr:YeeE/YedE family protein [Stenotrophomonas sp. A5586]WNH52198.1 YeeE/YedE family protein [Stenotrophomonas sp. A5586]